MKVKQGRLIVEPDCIMSQKVVVSAMTVFMRFAVFLEIPEMMLEAVVATKKVTGDLTFPLMHITLVAAQLDCQWA